jgi:DNA-binding winged helix-turn-helix (wHTH) protein
VVWADTVVGDAALTMCIQEIRKALQDNAKSPQYLETVHRQGFRFIREVVSSQQSVASKPEQSVKEQEVSSVMPAQAGIQGFVLCLVNTNENRSNNEAPAIQRTCVSNERYSHSCRNSVRILDTTDM